MNIDENLGFLVAYHRLDQVLPYKFHKPFLHMQYCKSHSFLKTLYNAEFY